LKTLLKVIPVVGAGAPHGQHHRRAVRGENLGGLEPEAGVRAGDHGQPAVLAGHVLAGPFRVHDSSRTLLTVL
jgi:hypothetical protein